MKTALVFLMILAALILIAGSFPGWFDDPAETDKPPGSSMGE